MTDASQTLDKVILVNLDDKVVGEMDKYQAHEHPAKLHRAVSVWLVNSLGQVLLQKRSDKKIVGAGWWGNAICGNVRPGESYEECAKRRLREEIGVGLEDLVEKVQVAGTKVASEVSGVVSEGKNSGADVAAVSSSFPKSTKQLVLKLEPVYKFTYKAYCNEKYGEYEVDQVFIGRYDGEVVLNKDEVSEVEWVDLEYLLAQVGENSSSVFATPEETLEMSLSELKNKTTSFEIEINGKKQLLAPWTVMMLRDKRLERSVYSS